MSDPDNSLIAEFNGRCSEEAFAALVRQHVNLVFATAFRQVGDAGAAEEITQNVFMALAQAAGRLGSHPTIAGWLHQTALNKSREWLRAELRRRKREQVAVNLDQARAEGDSVWSSLVPLLDEALLELREPDRLAVILHFMEGRTFQEVGSALGIGEDTARKRVNRCLDQLTHFFRRRGFATPALAAGTPLFALSAHPAPAGMVAAATQAGLAAHSSSSTLTLIKGALKIMAWSKAKTATVVSIGIILIVTGGIAIVISKVQSGRWQEKTADAYTRRNLSDPQHRDLLADLRANVWPKERQLAEAKIKSRQQADETMNSATIDLKSYINTALTDSPASPTGINGNNFVELLSGIHIFAGIPFDVEGLIQLDGTNMMMFQKHYPAEIDNIRINRKCAKIYLFQGANWIYRQDFGTVVAKLILHYTDGRMREIEIVAGEHVFDCWSPLFVTGVDPRYFKMAPGTERAWTGSNPFIKQIWPDESLILYKSTFENPQPDVAISNLDYVSTVTGTAPFLAGLTVE